MEPLEFKQFLTLFLKGQRECASEKVGICQTEIYSFIFFFLIHFPIRFLILFDNPRTYSSSLMFLPDVLIFIFPWLLSFSSFQFFIWFLHTVLRMYWDIYTLPVSLHLLGGDTSSSSTGSASPVPNNYDSLEGGSYPGTPSSSPQTQHCCYHWKHISVRHLCMKNWNTYCFQ